MNETLLIVTAVLVYIVVCIVFEAIVLTLFRVNGYGRSLWQSAVVNLVSLALIYVLWPLLERLGINSSKVFPLLPVLYLVTLLTEGVLLMLLNKLQSWKRILLAAAVMNGLSFGTLYLILSFL